MVVLDDDDDDNDTVQMHNPILVLPCIFITIIIIFIIIILIIVTIAMVGMKQSVFKYFNKNNHLHNLVAILFLALDVSETIQRVLKQVIDHGS